MSAGRRKVRVLLIEDRASDADLVLHELRRAGLDPDWERVEDEPGFRRSLDASLDLILADFNLPQFSALRALDLLKASGLDIPFIIVSGSIPDDTAVRSMRGGAQDYIFKNNLSRLGAAVIRELEASAQRRVARDAGEENLGRLQAIVDSALDAVVSMDANGRIVGWNRQAEAQFGWSPDEVMGRHLADVIIPADLRQAHRGGLARYLETGRATILNRRIEVRGLRRDGTEFPLEASITPVSVQGRQLFSGFLRDISARKQAELSQKVTFAINQALAESGSLEAVLEKVIAAICTNLNWAIGQIWLPDEPAGVLRCRVRWMPDDPELAEFSASSAAASFVKGEGIVGQVWAGAKPIWYERIGSAPNPELREAAVKAHLDSAVFTPLISDGKVVGVLEIISRGRRQADPDLVELMTDLSRRLGEFITRAQSEAALRESEARYRGLFFDVAVGQALVSTPGGQVLAVNRALAHMLGYTEGELTGQPVSRLADPEGPASARDAFARLTPSTPYYQVETQLVRKDGSRVPVTSTVTAIFDQQGVPARLLIQVQDLSQRKQAEQALEHARRELRHRELHDSVTGLPNRTQLQERLDQAIKDDGARPVSLLILDLDHFKEVNDAFGHLVGDRLLMQVGPRIRDALRATDLIARLGGDEFAVLLVGAGSPQARRVAEKIIEAMQRPFEISGDPVAMEASIGIATAPEHGDTAELLIRRADLSMYVAKRTRGTAAVYDPRFESEGAGHLSLMAELRQAIAENTLRLHYQPIVDVGSGRVLHLEALLRWNHPRLGTVPPDQFIPFAERTVVIQSLTDWVIRSAVDALRAWDAAGHRLPVAVNVSARNLVDPEFPERVARLAAPAPGGPSALTLEVTEGLLMAEPERVIERLQQLRRLGVRLSVDDFGTGYSSLAYLSKFPVQEMKIDRSFIRGLADDANRAAIVRAAVDLGHNLRLEVVAEGVEDGRTLDLLSALGCDSAQGYFVGRPMPAEAVPEFVRRVNGNSSAASAAA